MGKRSIFRFAVLASTALLATVLGGCAQSIEKSDSAGGKLQLITQGELGVCTFLPFKPFQFKEGGKIVGFDVDLIDLVAKDLKVKQSITDTPFEGIESGEALNSQKCDLAAAGMTITPERQQAMDFSKPYFNSTQALLTKNRSIDSLEKLRGKKVGVQQGTTGEVFAEKNKDRYGYETVQFEDTGLQLTAVKTGQVDASVNDNGVVYAFAKDNPDTAVTHEFKTGEQYGYAVQKGNKALLAKINQVLDKAKQDGAYAKIFQKWFGKKPTNEPGLK